MGTQFGGGDAGQVGRAVLIGDVAGWWHTGGDSCTRVRSRPGQRARLSTPLQPRTARPHPWYLAPRVTLILLSPIACQLPRCTLLTLLLAGCGSNTADMNVLAVGGETVVLDAGEAAIASFALDDCQGGTEEISVGERFDLLHPAPLAVPSGSWCGLAVAFEGDPFAGSLVLEGAAPGAFSVALNPGTAVVDTRFDVEDESVLVLDAQALLASTVGPQAVVIAPDDAAAEGLGDAVSDALWIGTIDEAQGNWGIYWPFIDVDFEVSASVTTGGCGGLESDADADADADSDADADADTDTDADADSDADADADGDSDADADADGDGDADSDGGCATGSSGGSGSCAGGGSSGSCEGGSSGSSGSCDGGGGSGSSSGCSSGGSSCGGGSCGAVVPVALVAWALRRRRW